MDILEKIDLIKLIKGIKTVDEIREAINDNSGIIREMCTEG